MRAFIEDYLEWCDELLGDPGGNARTTRSKRLRDLHAHHMTVFERMLRASGRSSLGYTEATIRLVEGTDEYALPGNFRRLIGFERRNSDDSDLVIERLPTVPEWGNDRGLIIISPQAGIRIRPVPTSTSDWTLMYQKAPVIMHWGWATTHSTGFRLLRPGASHWPQAETVADDDRGNMVTYASYYKGEQIHIIDENSALGGRFFDVTESSVIPNPVGQISDLNDVSVSTRQIPNPQPQDAAVRYEFRPVIPSGYDKLIALSVAIGQSAERSDPQRRGALKNEFREMFSGARAYMASQATDVPRKLHPGFGRLTVDPMAM